MYDFQRRERISRAIGEAMTEFAEKAKKRTCISCDKERPQYAAGFSVKFDETGFATAKVLASEEFPDGEKWIALADAAILPDVVISICGECALAKGFVKPAPEEKDPSHRVCPDDHVAGERCGICGLTAPPRVTSERNPQAEQSCQLDL